MENMNTKTYYLWLTILVSVVAITFSEENTAFGRRFVFSRGGNAQVVVTTKATVANVQLKLNGVLDEAYQVTGGVPVQKSRDLDGEQILSIESDQDILVQMTSKTESRPDSLMLLLPDDVLDNIYTIMGVMNYWNDNKQTLRVASTTDAINCTLTTAKLITSIALAPAEGFRYQNVDNGGSTLVCNNKVSVYDNFALVIPGQCKDEEHTMEINLPRRYFSYAFALAAMSAMCKPDTPILCCEPLPQFDCKPCQQFFRVVALKNQTRVKISAPTEQQFTLEANQIKDFFIPETNTAWLTSDKPVSVMQYQTGYEYNGNPDTSPIAVLVQPENSYLSEYTFASCFDATMKNFIRIEIETTEKDQLLLNGSPFLVSNPGTVIYGTKYSSYIHPFMCGKNFIQFTVKHPQGKRFALITFGWDDKLAYGSIAGLGQPGLDVLLQLNVTNETVTTTQCKSDDPVNVTLPEVECESECCTVPSPLTFDDSITTDGCQKIINRTWSITDDCNRTTTASQRIIVDQQLDKYEAPPEEIQLSSCDDLDDLNLASGPSLVCESVCGTTVNVTKADQVIESGCVVRTWTVEHSCGTRITYTQNITCSNGTATAPGSSCRAPVIEDIPFKKVEICHFDDHPKISKPKVDWDHKCCGGQLKWSSSQRTLRKTDCEKYVSIVWTVTDGCGVNVSKEEFLLLEKHLDQYKHPKDVHLDDCSKLQEHLLGSQKPTLRKDCGTTETVRQFDDKFDDVIIRTWKISNKCGKSIDVLVQRFSCSKDEGSPSATSPSVTSKVPEVSQESEESEITTKDKSCEKSGEDCFDESPECHDECDFIYLE